MFYCDCWKYNLTGGVFIFLFMVTGRGLIFNCSIVIIIIIIIIIIASLCQLSDAIPVNALGRMPMMSHFCLFIYLFFFSMRHPNYPNPSCLVILVKNFP